MSELKNRIESILFASGKSVSESDLADFCNTTKGPVKKALAQLKEDYEQKESSLAISNVEDKWKLTVKGKYTTDVQKIVSTTELPKPTLKTLSLIAFKSPVMQADIVHMRGQSAYEHIKLLAKQKLVSKEESGRTYILKITDKFYRYFDVEGDEDIKDMFKKLRESHEKKLGELEIVNTEKEEKEKEENKLGELEIVNVEPKTASRTDEELRDEKDFLKRIDKDINIVSQRVNEYKLPKRQNQSEDGEIIEKQTEINDATTTINEVKQFMDKEKEKETNNEEENKKKGITPLEELEQIANNVEEEEEENYI